MSNKRKKRERCCCLNEIPKLKFFPLPKIKKIPVRDVPDNCQIVCVGLVCFLACFANDE